MENEGDILKKGFLMVAKNALIKKKEEARKLTKTELNRLNAVFLKNWEEWGIEEKFDKTFLENNEEIKEILDF